MPPNTKRSRLSRAISRYSGKYLPLLQSHRARQAESLTSEEHNATKVALFRLPPEIRRLIMDQLFSGTIVLTADETDFMEAKILQRRLRYFPVRVKWPIEELIACKECSRFLGMLEFVPGSRTYGHSSLPRREFDCTEHSYDPTDTADQAGPLHPRQLLVSRTFYRDAYDALAAADYLLPASAYSRSFLYSYPCWPRIWAEVCIPGYVRKLWVEGSIFYVGRRLSTSRFEVNDVLHAAAYVHGVLTWLRASAPGLDKLEFVETRSPYSAYPEVIDYPETIDYPKSVLETHFFYLDYIFNFLEVKLTIRGRRYGSDYGTAELVLGKGGTLVKRPDALPLDMEKIVHDYRE